jgi:signal transduction histidine kinase
MKVVHILVVEENAVTRLELVNAISSFNIQLPYIHDSIEYAIANCESIQKWFIGHENEIPQILFVKSLSAEYSQLLRKLNPNLIIIWLADINLADLTGLKSINSFDYVIDSYDFSEIKIVLKSALIKTFVHHKVENDLLGSSVVKRNLHVIHELKTPVNALAGYLQMIRQKEFGNEIDAYMPIVERSLVRISDYKYLIDIVLEDEKQSFINLVNFDLQELIELQAAKFEPVCKQKNICIFIHSNKKLNLTAFPFDFEIIVSNLLSNAIKNSPQNGKINVYVFENDSFIVIDFCNTSDGAANTNFYENFSINKVLSEKNIFGSGLGFLIVNRMLECYNGSLEMVQNAELGIKITVRIPKPIRKY